MNDTEIANINSIKKQVFLFFKTNYKSFFALALLLFIIFCVPFFIVIKNFRGTTKTELFIFSLFAALILSTQISFGVFYHSYNKTTYLNNLKVMLYSVGVIVIILTINALLFAFFSFLSLFLIFFPPLYIFILLFAILSSLFLILSIFISISLMVFSSLEPIKKTVQILKNNKITILKTSVFYTSLIPLITVLSQFLTNSIFYFLKFSIPNEVTIFIIFFIFFILFHIMIQHFYVLINHLNNKNEIEAENDSINKIGVLNDDDLDDETIIS